MLIPYLVKMLLQRPLLTLGSIFGAFRFGLNTTDRVGVHYMPQEQYYSRCVNITRHKNNITEIGGGAENFLPVGLGESCSFNSTCIENAECKQYNGSKSETGICYCHDPYTPELYNGSYICEIKTVRDDEIIVQVGDVCSSSLMCINDAECRYDGSNSGTTRCLCPYGYVRVLRYGMYLCAAIIPHGRDPACYGCETNGGICYDTTDNQMRDGCVCPSFRSGSDCEVSYVKVSCNATAFTITVCYEEQVQYVTGGAVVLVAGKGMSPSCTGVKVTTDHARCPGGHHQLVLPLAESMREKCGTKKLLSDVNTIKYQNLIIVQHNLLETQPDDVSFLASCSYDTRAGGRFQPVGVAVVAAEHGEHHEPTLLFYMEDHLSEPIPDAVAIRLGDKVRFGITLIEDGTYTAIRVLRCLASSKSTINDPTAVTLPLIVGSCPSRGQNHITYENTWKRVSGKSNELRTGLVRMFRMSEGRSLHIHCTVRLCLKGFEEDCRPVECYPFHIFTTGRRKRSAPTIYTLSKTIYWYEDDTRQSSSSDEGEVVVVVSSAMFVVILGIIGVAMLIFIAIVSSLIWRKRHQTRNNITMSHSYIVSDQTKTSPNSSRA